MTTVLVVDDDPAICNLLREILEIDGHVIQTAVNGLEALDLARYRTFDLAMVDIWLPGLSGIEVLRRLKEQSPDLPVVSITCRPAYETAVQALRAGACDYVEKPFNMDALWAVVRQVLDGCCPPEQIQVGKLIIDLTTRRAWCEGQGLELTTTEFELLTYLVQRQGQVATYDELLEKVWNYQPETGSPEQVHTAMWRLRRKLERTPACPRLLATVRGVGYRLEPPPGDDDSQPVGLRRKQVGILDRLGRVVWP